MAVPEKAEYETETTALAGEIIRVMRILVGGRATGHVAAGAIAKATFVLLRECALEGREGPLVQSVAQYLAEAAASI